MRGAGLATSIAGTPSGSVDAANDAPTSGGDVAAPQDLPVKFIGRAGSLSLYVADSIDAVSDIWRQFQTAALHTPFQDIDWIVSWYQAAGAVSDHRPFIVLGYEDDELRLILPLAIVRAGGLNKMCWLAQSANDYNAPLIDPDFTTRCHGDQVAGIWTITLDACGPVDLVEFSQQPQTVAGQPNAFAGRDAVASSCDAHLVNLKPGWREFYASLRGSKSRRRLREKENKLGRLGTLQFRCEKEPIARRTLVSQAIAWKSQQLDATGDRNPFAPDGSGVSEIERTLLALCDAPGARHKLRVDSLYVDGKAVAVIIALVTGTRYSVFITAHGADETQKFSPGTILLVKAMQLACRAGYVQFDLLAGDEAYKMDWCDGHIALWDEVRGLTLKGKLAAPLGRLARYTKKKLKQSPRMLEIIKRVNKLRP
jgi:CelD/BcsL family acetyltransferase involved in cellulose biosynthesis